MTIHLTDEQTRRLWLRGQALVPPQADGPAAPEDAAYRACGLQAQDIFAAALGVRVRSTGACLSQVEEARNVTRSLIWTWAMRGTLHLLAREDVDWLVPLLGPVFVAAAARRRRELGLDETTYAQGLRAVRERLAEQGPATREELVAALAAAGLATGYRIERHLLYRAALEGLICQGPDRGAKPTFVLLADWLGRPLAPRPQPVALAELAARYLAAYAPATPADLAAWSGLPMADVREAWSAVSGDLVEVTAAGTPAWLPKARLAELDAPTDGPSVRLLPPFDTYLLGHRSRDLLVDQPYAPRINAGGGMIRAVLLVDGRVAGTWQTNRKGRRVNIAVDAFAELAPAVQAGVAGEVADIERFLGAPAG